MPISTVSGQRLRVALVLWSGQAGGAETVTASLARALEDEAVDATVVFVTSALATARSLVSAGIPFVECGYSRGRAVIFRPGRLATAVNAAGPDGAILQRGGFLPRALRIGGYSSVLVAVEHAGGRMVVPLMLRARLAAERFIERRAVDCRVAVSEFVRRTLVQGGERARYLEVIHNGVDLDRFRVERNPAETRSAVRIGFAARLVYGKGAPELIAAVHTLVGKAPFVLEIAGEGALRAELEALAQPLVQSGQVVFLGEVNDMPAFWGRMDVAVSPSNELTESFGMSAVEAMASGLPVVATRNGGLAEVVADGLTGQLVTPGDVSELAAALLRYLKDDGLRARHGARGRERVEAQYGIALTARAYAMLLRQLNEPSTAAGPRMPDDVQRAEGDE